MGDFLEFLLVAVPVAAAIGTPIYLFRRRINRLERDIAQERGQNQTAQIATEKSALEERVRVLERIVTSRGYTVAEEIEALRSPSPASAPVLSSAPSSADIGTPLNIPVKEPNS